MKKLIVLSAIILGATYGFAQNSNVLSPDEQVRVKQSIHLITYDTIGHFESALGEAYYQVVLNAFSETLEIPHMDKSGLTAHDQAKIEMLIEKFEALIENPPSWEEILAGETKFVIYKDKAFHRTPTYKEP